MIYGGNGENGVYIDYMAYNAYFHVLFENPDSFFNRVTRYGFFKFYARKPEKKVSVIRLANAIF